MPNINNWGHGGGLIAGIFLGWIFGYNEKRRENIFDKLAAAIFAGITYWLLLKSVVQGFFLIYT
jgi:rhomboid protease GluP